MMCPSNRDRRLPGVHCKAMPHLDAPQRYDLSDASRALHADPKRLIRQARTRQIPALWQDGGWVFPAAWVDAAAGRAPTDEPSIRAYWLERLSPPSSKARRATRNTTKLRGQVDFDRLLRKEEVCRRLYVDRAALERLTRTGILPPLRVNGHRHYDGTLIDLLARRAEGEPVPTADIDARIEALQRLARFEYRDEAGIPEPTPLPSPARENETPEQEDTAAVPSAPDPSQPAAYQIPDDLDLKNLGLETLDLEDLGPLIEADGFDVEDD